MAERTPYVDLTGGPPGSRLLVRREIPHPAAQLTFTDVHGYRYQLTLTNLADPDIAFLEALYRGRGRCEQVIRDLKATGLAHLPSADFAINQAWLMAVCLAGDLLAWFRGVWLAERGRQTSPARLRYTLLHVAGRRVVVRLAAGWPWAAVLTAAVARCQQRAIPQPQSDPVRPAARKRPRRRCERRRAPPYPRILSSPGGSPSPLPGRARSGRCLIVRTVPLSSRSPSRRRRVGLLKDLG